jgi:hypothetical protein
MRSMNRQRIEAALAAAAAYKAQRELSAAAYQRHAAAANAAWLRAQEQERGE